MLPTKKGQGKEHHWKDTHEKSTTETLNTYAFLPTEHLVGILFVRQVEKQGANTTTRSRSRH